jgi:hypothetical protein
LAATIATAIWLSATIACGQTARFDAPDLAEGREVTDAEFRSLHPSEKLTEFPIEVAADLGFAPSENIVAMMFQLRVLDPGVTIADFQPRSMNDSEIDGTIKVATSDETSGGLGFQVDSATALPWHIGSSANVGGKSSQSVQFERKPVRQPQISSGLVDRRSGLFIKLFRTAQQPLEGMHPIVVTLRMPARWRTGFVRLECEAISKKDSLLSETSYASSGHRSFLIPIFIAGDESARIQALAIRKSEQALRSAVAASERQVKPKTILAEVAQWGRNENKPSLTPTWLERVTNSPLNMPNTEADLPRGVAVAFKDHAQQKKAFLELAQGAAIGSVVMQRDRWSPKHSQ